MRTAVEELSVLCRFLDVRLVRGGVVVVGVTVRHAEGHAESSSAGSSQCVGVLTWPDGEVFATLTRSPVFNVRSPLRPFSR